MVPQRRIRSKPNLLQQCFSVRYLYITQLWTLFCSNQNVLSYCRKLLTMQSGFLCTHLMLQTFWVTFAVLRLCHNVAMRNGAAAAVKKDKAKFQKMSSPVTSIWLISEAGNLCQFYFGILYVNGEGQLLDFYSHYSTGQRGRVMMR